MVKKSKRIYIKSFGCSANLADGEIIAGCLSKAGFKIVTDVNTAEFLIFNTCAVKSPTENRIINILKKVPGVELVEMSCNREYANCCGAGGGLKVFDRTLTDAIAQKRIDEALETGAEVLVTACSTCNEVLQCAAESKALSRRMQVLDLSQFLTSRFARKKAFASAK